MGLWYENDHTELLLTVKVGPKAGTTFLTCTCGWSKDYPTKVGAIRSLNAHRKLNGLPPTLHWSDKSKKVSA